MPAPTPPPTIVIIGSGAMACLFAARFSAAGIPVGMLDEWPEGIAALQNRGVCLEDERAANCYPVAASSNPRDFAGVPLALVFVKTYQTARAANALRVLLPPDGLALTLQNGLGSAELLAEQLGSQRVTAGVTTLGAALLAPGRARATGSGEIILAPHSRLDALLSVLQTAGFSVRIEPEIQTVLWGKLVINAAINPVSALLGRRNGELLISAPAMQIIAAAAQEAAAVAVAQGIQLPYPDAVEQVGLILQRTSQNASSMLQDIRRGAPTEIEAINGAVVRAGAAYNMPTPVNSLLLQLVRALQNESNEVDHAETR